MEKLCKMFCFCFDCTCKKQNKMVLFEVKCIRKLYLFARISEIRIVRSKMLEFHFVGG